MACMTLGRGDARVPIGSRRGGDSFDSRERNRFSSLAMGRCAGSFSELRTERILGLGWHFLNTLSCPSLRRPVSPKLKSRERLNHHASLEIALETAGVPDGCVVSNSLMALAPHVTI